jgi:hypothetical protein
VRPEAADEEERRAGGPAGEEATGPGPGEARDEPALTFPPLLAQTAGLLAGAAPVDAGELARAVDQLFAHLGEVGEELPASLSLSRLSAWAVAAGGLVAAYGLAHWARRKQDPCPADPGRRPRGRNWFPGWSVPSGAEE